MQHRLKGEEQGQLRTCRWTLGQGCGRQSLRTLRGDMQHGWAPASPHRPGGEDMGRRCCAQTVPRLGPWAGAVVLKGSQDGDWQASGK